MNKGFLSFSTLYKDFLSLSTQYKVFLSLSTLYKVFLNLSSLYKGFLSLSSLYKGFLSLSSLYKVFLSFSTLYKGFLSLSSLYKGFLSLNQVKSLNSLLWFYIHSLLQCIGTVDPHVFEEPDLLSLNVAVPVYPHKKHTRFYPDEIHRFPRFSTNLWNYFDTSCISELCTLGNISIRCWIVSLIIWRSCILWLVQFYLQLQLWLVTLQPAAQLGELLHHTWLSV